jgi:hypothetical protein
MFAPGASVVTSAGAVARELGDLTERLDFTDGVLLQKRDAGRLGQGDAP